MEISISFGRPSVTAKHPWPTGTALQGGHDGVVIGNKPESNYRTAFVEAFSEDFGFIRGEGPDIVVAEDACWAKAQQALACPGHEWESRGYKNGGGFCIHCKRFSSKVFTPEQLGLFCPACGEATFWHVEDRDPVGEFVTCPAHTPHRDSTFCFCPPCKIKWDQEHEAREEITNEDIALALETMFGGGDG